MCFWIHHNKAESGEFKGSLIELLRYLACPQEPCLQ